MLRRILLTALRFARVPVAGPAFPGWHPAVARLGTPRLAIAGFAAADASANEPIASAATSDHRTHRGEGHGVG